jgi:hypothetical protein
MKLQTRNKKGVVFTILGAFTLCGILYLFLIFLDLFNILYAQTIFQGDVRASALHGASFYDLNEAGADVNNGVMVIQSQANPKYTADQTAEYNAKRLFYINFRNHYKLINNSNPNDFALNSGNPALQVKVYNLPYIGNGLYTPASETIAGYSHITHNTPGVAVYVDLQIKPWTVFFKNYHFHAYSYATPVDAVK